MSSFGFSLPGSGLHGQRVSRRGNPYGSGGAPGQLFRFRRSVQHISRDLWGRPHEMCFWEPKMSSEWVPLPINIFHLPFFALFCTVESYTAAHIRRKCFFHFLTFFHLMLGSAAFLPTVFDPLLTQNPKKAGIVGRKQWKTHRMNGGKKHKLEPKGFRFALETTYGPEGRGFESLMAYHQATPIWIF